MRKFKLVMIVVFAMMVVLVLGVNQIDAAILSFDDIGTPGDGSDPIPDGYGGFDWSKSVDDGIFYYINILLEPPTDSGLLNGAVSGDFVALPTPYVHEGKGWLSSITPFTFNGAYFTAIWRDGLNIQVDGFLEDGLIYSTTVVANTTGPTWFDFNYVDIDEIRFASSGGTHHEGYEYDNTQFVIDNFTYTPEPSSLLFLTLGTVLLRKGRTIRRKS